MRRDALERLIDNKLLSSVVGRLELSADREEVEVALEALEDLPVVQEGDAGVARVAGHIHHLSKCVYSFDLVLMFLWEITFAFFGIN